MKKQFGSPTSSMPFPGAEKGPGGGRRARRVKHRPAGLSPDLHPQGQHPDEPAVPSRRCLLRSSPPAADGFGWVPPKEEWQSPWT